MPTCRQFPVDALKIDRSFISRLAEGNEGEILLHTLVQLGKALSIETIAEGIEQPQELSLIKAEECDNGQGFLFARPLSAQDADSFFRQWPKTRRFEVRHEANALDAAKKIAPPEPVLALEPKSAGKDCSSPGRGLAAVPWPVREYAQHRCATAPADGRHTHGIPLTRTSAV